MPPPARSTDTGTGGENEINLSTVRDAGYTGNNSTIAVIDLDGYNTDHPEIEDQVVATNDTEADGDDSIDAPNSSHGTETAEIVAEVAPKADLVLVEVDDSAELSEKLVWLNDNYDNLTAVSISIAIIGVGPLDGTSFIDEDINNLVTNGTAFVSAAGNQADGSAVYTEYSDGDGDDVVNFTASREWVTVESLDDSQAGEVYLQWDDWDTGGADEDYSFVLYNESGVITTSNNTQDGSTADPVEVLEVRPKDIDQSNNTYPRVRIEYNSGDRDAKFTIQSFDATFTQSSTNRTVTIPSTGNRTLTVGAYGPAGDESEPNALRSFSSRGPTIDGRIKPELLGPDGTIGPEEKFFISGTSYAAPHVAGTAALLKDANESITPTELRSVLTDTATDVRGNEPNNQTGFGLLNASGALAQTETEPPVITAVTGADLEDGDDRLVIGDAYNVTTNVSDDVDVQSVTANLSAFGGPSNATMNETNTTDVYRISETVGENASEGATNVTVTVNDTAGNTNESTVAVGPTVENVVFDPDPSVATNRTVMLGGSVVNGTTDGTTEAPDELSVRVSQSDGDSATTTVNVSSTNFSITLDLDSTDLSATGGDGNWTSNKNITFEIERGASFDDAEADKTIILDTSPPAGKIDSTPESAVNPGDTIQISVTPTEDIAFGTATVAVGSLTSTTIEPTANVSTGVSLTIPGDASAASYDVTLEVTDAAENANETAATAAGAVTVEIESNDENDEDDDSDDGGGGGGGGSGGGAPPAPTQTATPTPTSEATSSEEVTDLLTDGESSSEVTEVNTDGNAVSATVDPPADAESVTATIEADAVADDESVAADRVQIESRTVEEFKMDIEADPSPDKAPVDRTAGSVEITSTLSNDQITRATTTVTVSDGRLNAAGLSPAEVTVYRLHDDEWSALETDVVERTDSGAVLEFTTPGFSAFVIGENRSDSVSVTDATVPDSEVSVGEEVRVVATVRNNATSERTIAVNVSIGDRHQTERVTVPAGESRNISASTVYRAEDGPQTADVYVDGMYVDTVTIEEAAAPADSDDDRSSVLTTEETTTRGADPTTATGDPTTVPTVTDSTAPGFGPVTTLFAAGLALALLVRRTIR